MIRTTCCWQFNAARHICSIQMCYYATVLLEDYTPYRKIGRRVSAYFFSMFLFLCFPKEQFNYTSNLIEYWIRTICSYRELWKNLKNSINKVRYFLFSVYYTAGLGAFIKLFSAHQRRQFFGETVRNRRCQSVSD